MSTNSTHIEMTSRFVIYDTSILPANLCTSARCGAFGLCSLTKMSRSSFSTE